MFKIRIGGLLRCCTTSLVEQVITVPKEGDKVTCHYCKSPCGGMIFRDGAFEWDRKPLEKV